MATQIDSRTLADLAAEALAVQADCNLSVVVHAFSRSIKRLRELLRDDGITGTEYVNRHAVCALYANAIGCLSYNDDTAWAFAECTRLAGADNGNEG